MNLLDKLRDTASWPKRWRISHGFGVHSPFAFDFITKVLRAHDTYYYAFPEIDLMCGRSQRSPRHGKTIFSISDFEKEEAHMIFRILCCFRPEHIVNFGGGNEVSMVIYKRAMPDARVWRWSREDLNIIETDRPCVDIVHAALEMNRGAIRATLLKGIHQPAGRVVIFRNMYVPAVRKVWEEVTASVNFGMTFHDRFTGIFVALPHLPRQDYPMLL